MNLALRVETKVLPGHRIEVQGPELPEGQDATVFVVLHGSGEAKKRPLLDILAEYKGPVSFRTAAEVDAYLREERDSWDR